MRILREYFYTLTTFVLLWSVCPAFSDTSHLEGQKRPVLTVEEVAENEAIKAFTEWARPYVHKTNRVFDTYHFVKGSDIGYPDTSSLNFQDEKVNRHHVEWGTHYWNLSQRLRTHAQGFYLASDPVVSAGFGGNDGNWVMYRVTIPEGVSVFDSKREAAYHVTPEVEAKLRAAGCETKRSKDLLRDNYSLPCRRIALGALKAIGVDAILYDWIGANFEGFERRKNGALILINPEVVPEENIAIFTKHRSLRERPEEKAIFNEFVRLMIEKEESNGASVTHFKPPSYWSDLKEKPTVDLKDWASKRWMETGTPIW